MHDSPNRGIRCILFDLGGTLWERRDRATWAALEREANAVAVGVLRGRVDHNAALTLDDVTLGAALREQVENALKAARRHDRDNEPDFAGLAEEALQTIGISQADRALGAAVYEALRVRAVSSRVLFPDALDTLAELRARGYALGVVTNRHYGGRPFLDDLDKMGLLAFFAPDHIAISADLGWRKPHPAIFMHALHSLGVEPTQAAMVGDTLEADVYGAQRLGLFTVWKPAPAVWAEALAARSASAAATSPALSERAEPSATLGSEGAYVFAHALAREQPHRDGLGDMAAPNAVVSSIRALLALFVGGEGTTR